VNKDYQPSGLTLHSTQEVIAKRRNRTPQ